MDTRTTQRAQAATIWIALLMVWGFLLLYFEPPLLLLDTMNAGGDTPSFTRPIHHLRDVLLPAEVLYKRPVLVERGSFRPVTHVNIDMLECACRQFLQSLPKGEEPVVLMELTMNRLQTGAEGGAIDYDDFLARASRRRVRRCPVWRRRVADLRGR